VAITAILELQLKADAVDTAHQVLHATLAGTRAFPGCLGVTVLVDDQNPARVLIVERWESMDSDRAYRAWRATPEGATELGAVLGGRPELSHYTEADGV
jgi:quinol monooxygenase YgiN